MFGNISKVITSAQTVLGSGNERISSNRIQGIASKLRVQISYINICEKKYNVTTEILLLLRYITVIYYNKDIVPEDPVPDKIAKFLNELFSENSTPSHLIITENDARDIVTASKHCNMIVWQWEFTRSIGLLCESAGIVIPPGNSDELSRIHSALFGGTSPIRETRLHFGLLSSLFGWSDFSGKTPLDRCDLVLKSGCNYARAQICNKYVETVAIDCNICGADFTGTTFKNFKKVEDCFFYSIADGFTMREKFLWQKTINSLDSRYSEKKSIFLLKLDQVEKRYWQGSLFTDGKLSAQSSMSPNVIDFPESSDKEELESKKQKAAAPRNITQEYVIELDNIVKISNSYDKLISLKGWIQRFRMFVNKNKVSKEQKLRIILDITTNADNFLLEDRVVFEFLKSIRPDEFEIIELPPTNNSNAFLDEEEK